MKFPIPVSLKWIADFIGAEIFGNQDQQAYGINEIHKVEPGDITFVERGLGDVVHRDVVTDVDYARRRGDSGDDAFHDGDEVIGEAEIRG